MCNETRTKSKGSIKQKTEREREREREREFPIFIRGICISATNREFPIFIRGICISATNIPMCRALALPDEAILALRLAALPASAARLRDHLRPQLQHVSSRRRIESVSASMQRHMTLVHSKNAR